MPKVLGECGLSWLVLTIATMLARIDPSSSGQALTTADHFRLDFGYPLISHALSSMWPIPPSMTSNRRSLACSPPSRMSEGGPRVSRLCRTWLTWSGGIVRKRGRHRAISSISAIMEPWSSATHSRDSVRMSCSGSSGLSNPTGSLRSLCGTINKTKRR